MAVAYNAHKVADLVDPGDFDIYRNRYLFTTMDVATKWSNAWGVPSKEPNMVAVALQDDARDSDGFAKLYATDCGGEFHRPSTRPGRVIALSFVPCARPPAHHLLTRHGHDAILVAEFSQCIIINITIIFFIMVIVRVVC